MKVLIICMYFDPLLALLIIQRGSLRWGGGKVPECHPIYLIGWGWNRLWNLLIDNFCRFFVYWWCYKISREWSRLYTFTFWPQNCVRISIFDIRSVRMFVNLIVYVSGEVSCNFLIWISQIILAYLIENSLVLRTVIEILMHKHMGSVSM